MNLVILDRDGTINHDSPSYIKSPQECKFIDGSVEAIGRLSRAGYLVAVATNQAAIARGFVDLDTLEAIHDKIRRAAADFGGRIDRFFHCPHAPEEQCECRKPRPGLLRQISAHYALSLKNVYLVGDTLRDLQAAAAAGARPALVLTNYGRRTISEGGLPEGTQIFADLSAFADHLLAQHRLVAR